MAAKNSVLSNVFERIANHATDHKDEPRAAFHLKKVIFELANNAHRKQDLESIKGKCAEVFSIFSNSEEALALAIECEDHVDILLQSSADFSGKLGVSAYQAIISKLPTSYPTQANRLNDDDNFLNIDMRPGDNNDGHGLDRR